MSTKEQPAALQSPSLSPQRAFVVHFRAAPYDGRCEFAGRAEHLVSGRAAHFDSEQAFWRFIDATLNQSFADNADFPTDNPQPPACADEQLER